MLLEGERDKQVHERDRKVDSERLEPSYITDRGKERDVNEDRCGVIKALSGMCAIVLDGMGGVEGGEFAAQLAFEAFQKFMREHPTLSPESLMRGAVDEAHRVVKLRRQNQTFVSMGTTVVALHIDHDEVVVANVGDSRAYLVREGNTEQLSVDHTVVQELVDRHEIRKEDALTHPQSHILTQCLGGTGGLSLSLRRYWIWASEEESATDVIVLCSDGLYSLVPDEEIGHIASTHSPEETCSILTQIANDRGGYDNISVVVVPLGGILRDEPPSGWEQKVAQRAREKERIANNEAKGSTHLMFAFLVCGVTCALTCVAFVLFNIWGR
jgi:PPM family protein phosphatase